MHFPSCISDQVGTRYTQRAKSHYNHSNLSCCSPPVTGRTGLTSCPLAVRFCCSGLAIAAGKVNHQAIKMDTGAQHPVVPWWYLDTQVSLHQRLGQTVIGTDVFPEVRQPLFPSFHLGTLKNSGKSSLQRQVGEETEGLLTFKVAPCLCRIKEVG